MAKQVDVRFSVPTALHTKWWMTADKMGLTLPNYLRLRCMGVITDEDKPMPMREAPAPVQNPIQEDAMQPAIRVRLLEVIGPGGQLRREDIPAVARKLGLKTQSVFASLGSMVASGRMRRDEIGGTYHVVTRGDGC